MPAARAFPQHAPARPGPRLLRWYRRSARDLPWRRTRDPYALWVSEVMLQQTRVATVIPYFRRFLKRFPSLQALAAAPLQEVLQAWEGMGYYTRARNLHRAARLLARSQAGAWPHTKAGWEALPGVGRYTASAIASIAFGERVAVLDGNVRRVLARLYDYAGDVRSSQGERALWALAQALVPAREPGTFNQALMELGATVCLARNPACAACPLRLECLARRRGTVQARPQKRPVHRLPHYQVTAGVIRRRGRVLIDQRPQEKLLGGLWEFPGGKRERGESLAACLARELREELGILVRVAGKRQVLRHSYTHFRITLHVFDCEILRGEPEPLQVAALRWVYPAGLDRYPMGKTDRQTARSLSR